MIEHANLSVCVSDAFMDAVANDSEWRLVWDGKVHKTVRARDLWNLICESAWLSAEPGVVFMERYNHLSNTWYYENIRCVNPCVTGDTLIYTANGLRRAADLAREGGPVRSPLMGAWDRGVFRMRPPSSRPAFVRFLSCGQSKATRYD